ncbi:MAG: hypothetical protein HYV25_03290 [Candidatus Harrisonbacteria bacterium]|nr:hypothetical protein [Candidatus Harrisonbacteria bacterium]
MPKSKVTIEDLARMVQEGFGALTGEMNSRFDDIVQWRKFVNGRFDVIEIELMDIKKRLDEVIYRREFEVLKDRVERLEKILVRKSG